VRACPRCEEGNSDRARFCQACGTPLAPADAVSEVRKIVTVLFSDIAGSTSLGERLDPESLRRLMGRYFDSMREVLEHHGGTVEKYIGDAIMAVFGIPRLHEDDAFRAVRAAAGMRERLSELNEDLREELGVEIAVRTGIHTGEVVAGDPSQGQTLVTGDAVNTAARLEQAARAGEILIGEPTYRLVRDAVVAQPLEPVDAKGKAEPVPAYRLDEVIVGAEARARRLDAPMVGRDAELRAILDAFERSVADRTCRIVTVLGEAGVGKSRLVLEALGAIGDRSTVLRGRCLPYGEGITYWPVAEAIRQAAAISDEHPRDEAQRRIAGLLEGLDRSDRIADGVAELIGLGEGARSAEEGFWAVRRFFEGLASAGPLVLVFDDIHWGEETFLDLLGYVVEWTDGVPVFVLCLARKELLDRRPGWATGPSSAVVVLESLGRGECDALLRGLLGTRDVPAEVTTAIEGTAEGNPLFVEELLAMLIDDGLLVHDEGDWVPSPDLGRVAVPPTVQALLAARLEQLDLRERRVLEGASVVGEVFEWSAVAELVPSDLRSELGGHLMSLVRKEVIRPSPSELADEDAFRFRHLLIRDAAYEGMAKETRAELHERFARWLERAAPERVSEMQAIVGYHLERALRYREDLGTPVGAQADLAREAAGHLGEAGRRSLARADMPAAANLLGRAVAISPLDDERRPRLMIDLVDALRELGGFDRVEQLAEEGVALARARGDRGLELRFALRQLAFRLMGNPVDVTFRDLIVEAEAIAAEAAALDDPATEGEALVRVSRMLGDIGRTADAEQVAARAKECFDRAGVISAELAFILALTFSWQGPRPCEEEIVRGEQALSSADETSPVAAYNLLGMAVNLAMVERFDEARSLGRRGASTLRELGMALELAATGGMSMAIVELVASDLEAAETAIRPAYDTLKEMGELGRLSSRGAVLAEVLYRQERYEESLHVAEEAVAISAPDDMEPQIWSRSVRAKALARFQRFDEAERDARASVAFSESTDWPGYQGTAWLALAEVLSLAARPKEGAEAASEAEARFERKGSTVMAARARAFREELEADGSGPVGERG
jgi:class 3 adenylate cyclase/tetratricopeptide (TPR) repeat protein